MEHRPRELRRFRKVKWGVLLGIVLGVLSVLLALPAVFAKPESITIAIMDEDNRPLRDIVVVGCDTQRATPCAQMGTVTIPLAWSPISIRDSLTGRELMNLTLSRGERFRSVQIRGGNGRSGTVIARADDE